MTYVIGEAPGPAGTVMVRSVARISEISSISEATLRDLFTFRNLLDEWPGYADGGGSAFDVERAREAARAISGRRIYLGRRVAAAFAYDAPWFVWKDEQVVVPHPSGVSKIWNDPKMVARARTFWQRAVHHELANDERRAK